MKNLTIELDAPVESDLVTVIEKGQGIGLAKGNEVGTEIGIGVNTAGPQETESDADTGAEAETEVVNAVEVEMRNGDDAKGVKGTQAAGKGVYAPVAS